MCNQDWLNVPEPVSMAFDFVNRIQNAKASGLQIDGEAGMASVAASQVLRRYFGRVELAIANGHFDPANILQYDPSLQEMDDGEEL